ncbi:MAG TPA: heterodisulfide reductase-related iron-sulfur binding cluster [Phycisphaeraceae bacterium]
MRESGTSPAPRVVSGLGANRPGEPASNRAKLPVLELDHRTYSHALDCVHCGLCLPVCPTYLETRLEADSPRGRIALIKNLADGAIEPSGSVLHHLDLCLDCRACEPACPSGVVYHELIEEARAKLAPQRRRTLSQRLLDAVLFHLLPHPRRLKAAMLPVRLMQRIGLWEALGELIAHGIVPPAWEKMRRMTPDEPGPLWPRRLKTFYPSTNPNVSRPVRVAFLAGCVGNVMFQALNRQSIALLQLVGCDVYVPRSQGCCGAIAQHGGRPGQARAQARRNLSALGSHHGEAFDFIVTNAAGCGAMLKAYARLLEDDPARAEAAGRFASRVRDICELLADLELPPPRHEIHRTAVYHDACHLLHAQGVGQAPRKLLGSIRGLKLLPLAESGLCCGAAGTYNLTQPQMAQRLAQRKLEHIVATGASVCVTGNIGCLMQIRSEAQRLAVKLEVVHPVTLLHQAYFAADHGQVHEAPGGPDGQGS